MFAMMYEYDQKNSMQGAFDMQIRVKLIDDLRNRKCMILKISGVDINISSLMFEISTHMNALQSLYLHQVGLDDTILSGLPISQKFSALEVLSLRDNAFTDMGIEFFCKGLEKNDTLKTLDLSGNAIGDFGCELIFDALRLNTTLQLMILDNIGITDMCAKTIVTFLGATTIPNISIGCDEMLESNKLAVFEAFMKNDSIATFCGLNKDNLRQILAVSPAELRVENEAKAYQECS